MFMREIRSFSLATGWLAGSLGGARRIIVSQLADKGYAGPLSVELFLPKYQQGDPFEVAREIRQKAESVMRQARVI